jgi:hypothetical protein
MYKIPKDGDIVLAIRNVMVKFSVVRSQHELKRLVDQELSRGDEQFRVSGSRVRRLALLSGVTKVEVHTRGDGPKTKKVGTNCPVCGAALKKSKNKTVEGKTVTLGYFCPNCSYSTGKDKRYPSRYIFSRRRK